MNNRLNDQDRILLFSDPKINYPIYQLSLPFADYVAQCKSIIRKTRLDLTPSTAEHIIDVNAPFELQPSEGKASSDGVLLIHGLLDSPFQCLDIGSYLQSQGMLVRSILLPGHGTVPGALLHTDYHQWLQALRFGIASFAKKVDRLFLLGNSTGAALACYQALLGGIPIAGVIGLSPALKIRSSLAPLASWYPFFKPFLKHPAWFSQDPDETMDYAKYRSMPFNAIQQVYELSKAIAENGSLSHIRCPLLLAISADDNTVSSRATLDAFSKHDNPASRLILYTNQNKKPKRDARIILRQSAFPEQNIRRFSHICIPIAPTNPHYGQAGDYLEASHNIDSANLFVYSEPNNFDIAVNKCLIKLKCKKRRIQRLTFNPDFQFLTESISVFIKK